MAALLVPPALPTAQPVAVAVTRQVTGASAFDSGRAVAGSVAGTVSFLLCTRRQRQRRRDRQVTQVPLSAVKSEIRPEIYRIGEAQRSFFYSQCPVEDLRKPEFAFFGQSNVGKSSMLNFLCNRRKLSTISKHPGHTKLIHHFLCENSFYLVDLPGTGQAKGAGRELKQMTKIVTAYVRHRSTLAELFYLVDGSARFSNFDLQGIKWLVDSGVNLSVILTKMDMAPSRGLDRADELLDLLYEMPESPWRLKKDVALPLVFKCSAKERTGREAVLEHIADLRRAIVSQGRGSRKKKDKALESREPPAIR